MTAARPLLVLLNMAIILAIVIFGVEEIRQIVTTEPGYSEWESWSTCTKTCNSGTRRRRRYCNNPPPSTFGPHNCSKTGPGYEVIPCNINKCPIDGNFGPWTRFNNCSKICGGGVQKRIRLCVHPPPQFGGRNCQRLGAYSETHSCNEHPCPVNGGYSSWSEWSACSKTCGTGEHERTRSCDNPLPKHTGKDCSSLGPNKEKQQCEVKACPVNGGYGQWGDWSKCSVTCGGGTKERKRPCNNPVPQYGGKDCSSLGSSSETQKCNTGSCNIDGGYSEWSEWSKCSATCGDAQQMRKRTCTNPKPRGSGKNCKSLGASKEIIDCELKDCPTT